MTVFPASALRSALRFAAVLAAMLPENLGS
jgi:hypothetical protein